MGVRILLADDHVVVRHGLRMVLELDPELEVVGEASDGKDVVEQARSLRPDLVLMDLIMPGVDGVAATATIRQELPDTEVLALTSVIDSASVTNAIRAGAIGYLLKDVTPNDLRRAVRAAAAGQVQLSPQATAMLLRGVTTPEHPDTLTHREKDVLGLMARGRANKEIARELHIGDQTVKTHVSSILAKLGVQSRTQAALHAIQLGLVSTDEVAGT